MDKALLVLKARTWKWLLCVVLGVLFVVVGWHMIQGGSSSDRIKGWFVLVVFSFFALIALLPLTVAPSRVVLTAQGLFIQAMFRKTFVPWAHVKGFGVHEWTQWHGPFRQRHRQVGMVLHEEHRPTVGRLGALARGWSGFDGVLPDNYGYKHQALADLLNRYLEASRNER